MTGASFPGLMGVTENHFDGKAPVRCSDCHGNHEIKQGRDGINGCVKCHSKIVDEQHQSLHGRAAADQSGDLFL